MQLRRFGGIAIASLALVAPAGAEGNRLLPFWGQPYPYGYAWTDPRPPLGPAPTCRDRDPARRAHRHGWAGRCEVVLHARD